MNVFARRPAPAPKNNVDFLSIGDPRFARWLGGDSAAGVPVTEYTALTVSAVWRAAMLVSSSTAGLPLETMRQWGQTRTQIPSWVDDPASSVGYKPFNWKQTSILHMLLGGDSFQRHLYAGGGYEAGGPIAGLEPINPRAVGVYWDCDRPGGKRFEVTYHDGTHETLDKRTMTQIMGPTLDGLRGLSVIGMARTSFGGAIAADRAAAKTFANGPMVSAIATADEDLEAGDAAKASAEINDTLGGSEHAGRVAVLSRKFTITPWSMTLKDAQFLESRQFSISEIARWFGVPGSLLEAPGSVSTWGTGVEIQQRGLGRFTLPMWTAPFQEAISDLLPRGTWCQFDFRALERGAPQDEITLIASQIEAGLLTINQALEMLNRPGIGPDGDITRVNGMLLTGPAGEQVSPTSAIPATAGADTAAFYSALGARA